MVTYNYDRIHIRSREPMETARYFNKMFGAEKLLYGTDHPFSHFDEYNVMVEALSCTDAERELINHGNAEALLGL